MALLIVNVLVSSNIEVTLEYFFLISKKILLKKA
jgi:hypothetical protein